MPRRILPIAAVILAIALVATLALAWKQHDDLSAARKRADRLQEILAKALERLDEREEESLLGSDGLFGDLGAGGFGDPGDTGDLFGDLDIGALSECLGTGDLLGGGGDLFGGGGEGLDRLLEDLEKGDTSGDPEKALEDLLGGLGSSSGAADDGSARSQIGTISRQIEDIRKLEFESNVKVRFLPPKAVAARAARLMLTDYPADVAASEGRVLAALGAVSPGADLRRMAKELLESQVAGFYVPATGELVVPSTNPRRSLTANEKIVLAHELEHALADQRLGLPVPERPDPSESDGTLAALSLAEGDATLTMQRYALAAIPIFEQLSMLSDPNLAAAQDALAETPHFLSEQLLFPYTAGLEFDCALYTKRGWRAVNRAYKDPPTTSAQVMFPDRYLAGERAADVPDPVSPGSGWTRELESTFGAAHLMWLLQAPGDDEGRALEDPEGAASAWAGGEVHLFTRGAASAVAVVLAQRAGDEGLCDAVAEWYDSAFEDKEVAAQGAEELARDGTSQDAVVWCSGDEVRVGIGPDLNVARTLVD